MSNIRRERHTPRSVETESLETISWKLHGKTITKPVSLTCPHCGSGATGKGDTHEATFVWCCEEYYWRPDRGVDNPTRMAGEEE